MMTSEEVRRELERVRVENAQLKDKLSQARKLVRQLRMKVAAQVAEIRKIVEGMTAKPFVPKYRRRMKCRKNR